MKMKIKITFLLSALLVLVGCKCEGGKENVHIPNSGGTPYEVIIVTNSEVWKSDIVDSLRNTLQRPVEMINFDEPSFDLINIHPKNFGGLYSRHRNIILVNIDPKYTEPKSYMVRNKYAKPQIITIFEAADRDAMKSLIANESNNVFARIELEEQQRFADRVSNLSEKNIGAEIKKMFGFEIMIPRGYKVRNTIQPDFIWLSYEMATASQGVVIYDYPYNGEPITADSLIMERNRFIGQVPSQAPNSQMQTSDVIDPEMSEIVINGRTWYQLRGFWNVKNDFMGGPFVSYATIDTNRNRVVVIDTYVFAPDHTKKQRNHVRQLESLVRTVKF